MSARPNFESAKMPWGDDTTFTACDHDLPPSERKLSTEALDLRYTTSRLSQHPRTSIGSLVYIWRWELSIWLLGTAGLLANIALLARYNEQRAWKSSVQITAFVAALAQLSQSALLVPIGSSIGQAKWKWLKTDRKAIDVDRFDLASRGPDGSLRLLWHLRLRPCLVSLGALSMLLMLAFPTFVQQSLSINLRQIPVLDHGASYVKRATAFVDGFDYFDLAMYVFRDVSEPDPVAMVSLSRHE